MEDRILLAAHPLRVVLVSDAVLQANQVVATAAPGVIALTYDSHTADTATLVDLLGTISAEHGGAPIAQVGLVAHGAEGRVALGTSETLDLAALTRDGAALDRLRGLLAPDARLDLYSCYVAAGTDGKSFVSQLAADTGAAVYASDHAVGSGSLGDFTWDDVTHAVPGSADLLSVPSLEQIPGLKLDDVYEPNGSKTVVDGRPAGGTNSPNLGLLTKILNISNLVLASSTEDWFKFQTAGVSTFLNSVSLNFDTNAGDIDLYVYDYTGTHLLGFAANNNRGNVSPESVGISGYLSGTYYVRVVAHNPGAGIGQYSLTITAPAATGDDVYEPNNSKAVVDARAPGTNSPNLGGLTGTTEISNLVLNTTGPGTPAEDWFKFQTAGVATTSNFVSLSFDTNAGDIDLYVYDYTGTHLLGFAANNNRGNISPETVGIAGYLSGTYYVRVLSHNPDFGINLYKLTINAPGVTGDDVYEQNNSKGAVDARAPGPNSPNLGGLTSVTTIPNLVLNNTGPGTTAEDWFKFQTSGVGAIGDSVNLAFDTNAGDIDLYVYDSTGTHLLGFAANNNRGNLSPETVSLAGYLSGTYYVRVLSHNPDFGIDNYTLQVSPPGNTGDDPYENNHTKALVDSAPEGTANSSNFGLLTALTTIQNLALNKPADGTTPADWFKFKTAGVGTTTDAVGLTFNTLAGDIDLYVYDSTGTRLLGSAANNNRGNVSPETVSLSGYPQGTYYLKVLSHNPDFGIDNYTLQITAPPGGPSGSLQFAAPSYTVNDSAGTATFTVTRVGGSVGTVSALFSTQDGLGTAVAGTDYTSTTGTISFPDGVTTPQSFTVPILENHQFQGSESVNVVLAGANGGATFGTPSNVPLTILNDAPQPPGAFQFDVATFNASESDGLATITVDRPITAGAKGTVTVDYATSDGTGVAGTNYTTSTGTLTFGDGVTSQTFTVPILDDNLVNGDRTVNLTLGNPTGGAILGMQPTAVLDVADADAAGAVQFDSSIYTANVADGTATITVTRSNGTAGGVTVHYATTTDGTAVPGIDYTSTSGTLTFGPKDLSKSFTIPLLGNPNPSGDQTISLALDSPGGGATLGAQSTAAVIIRPAGSLQFSAIAYSVDELGGTETINVTRTGGSAGVVTVHYATADGTGVAGTNYQPTNGTLTFADGDTAAKTITIPILDDNLVNGDKTANVALDAPTGGAVLGAHHQVVLTISEADGAGTIQFGAATYRVKESGGTATVTVTRTGGTAGGVTVHYATTASGTAVAGTDFTPTSGTLTFGPNATSQTFTIPLLNNPNPSGDQTIGLALDSPAGATLGAQSTAAVIVSPAGSLQFDAASYSVGELGGMETINVTRTGGSDGVVTVHYATADGTGVAGTNYQPTNGTLTFADGDTAAKTITIPVLDDDLVNGDRTANVALDAPTGGAVLGAHHQVVLTISEADGAGTIQFGAATYRVKESGGTATVTVTRTGGAVGGVTVHYATSDGTAIAGTNYETTTGTLTFDAGVVSQTFSIPIDVSPNPFGTRTVNLALETPGGGATLGTPQTAVLTIADDDRGVRGDYDGDRKTDLGIFDATTSTLIAIPSRGGAPLIQQFGDPSHQNVAVFGDYYGTGQTDLGIFDATTSTLIVVPPVGSTGLKPLIQQFGNPSHNNIPISGDYYGTGQADLGIFDATTSTLIVVPPVGSTGLKPLIQQFGDPSHRNIPVSGDYYGTGQTDLGIFDATMSTLIVVPPVGSTGLKPLTQQFGDPSHKNIPVTGDYYGTGQSDLGIFDATTSTLIVVPPAGSTGLKPLIQQFGDPSHVNTPVTATATLAAPRVKGFASSLAASPDVVDAALVLVIPEGTSASVSPSTSAGRPVSTKANEATLATALDAIRVGSLSTT